MPTEITQAERGHRPEPDRPEEPAADAGVDIVTASDPAAQPATAGRRSLRDFPRWFPDAAICGGYALLALFLVGRLWVDIEHRYLGYSVADQQGFEWIIANVTQSVLHGGSLFFTPALNAPLGVNLMAQTSILGLSLPLLPVTLIFGPATTFTVLLTGALAGTAIGWYVIFSRHLVGSRFAAAIGGALCGFAPPMISHASGGHVNYVAQFALPFIVWRVIRLREPGRWLVNGGILGLLLAYQIFVGEEPLLLCALGVAVFVISYAIMQRDAARAALRPFLAGTGFAAAVAGLITGYPLWFQFYGPQSYAGIPHAQKLGNDILSLTTFASNSLGGGHPVGAMLAYNPTEENGFLGWPLLAIALAAAVWLWRESAVVRAAGITAAVFLVASLGVNVVVNGKDTGIPGLWRLAVHLPLVSGILPGRVVFIAIPAIATILVLAIARLVALIKAAEPTVARPLRLLALGALAAALLPIAPTPLVAVHRSEAPRFFTAGTWRQHVAPGRSILAVPPPDGSYVLPVRWQIAADMGFNHVEGYFMGPHGADRHGWYGAERRPTAALLNKVWLTGEVPTIGSNERATAVDDIRFWQVDAVVLGPGNLHPAALRRVTDQLFGPGREIDGVWVWDVRPITQP